MAFVRSVWKRCVPTKKALKFSSFSNDLFEIGPFEPAPAGSGGQDSK
jgi:hypothetical protein